MTVKISRETTVESEYPQRLSALVYSFPTTKTSWNMKEGRKERKGKERKGKERKGKERKGKEKKRKERKGKERNGKERKGNSNIFQPTFSPLNRTTTPSESLTFGIP